MRTPVSLVHVDLIVTDVERALGFYVGLLGCEVADDAIVEGAVPAWYSGGAARRMRIVMLRLARFGAMIELMGFAPAWAPAAGSGGMNLSVLVDDLDAARARLAAAGVASASEVMDVELPRLGGARIAFVRDPDGHLVELVEARRPT